MPSLIIPINDSTAGYSVPLWINGKEHQASKRFDVVSPTTGQVVHMCDGASAEDAAAAVDAAAEAFKTWRTVTPAKRRDIFLKTAEVMERRQEELAGYMAAETGAAPLFIAFNVKNAVDMLKDVAGRIATIEGMIPSTSDEGLGAMVLKEPYGVVLGIAPWNAPYILGVRAIAYPIAAGNTAILKGSELSPRVFWAIASCFHEAGLPAGVLNMIVHAPADAPSITADLIRNPHVKKINFTGSTAVGRIIGRLAGEQLKPLLLELGGKAPAIVWEDANLDLAADQCALGSFMHAGQICMSTERILVHKNVREEFEKKFTASVNKFFPAQGEAPILISSAGVDKNRHLVSDALSKGATAVTGDPSLQEPSKFRMRPIVISNVTPEMEIYQTESFGPTVSLIEIDSEEEAMRIANDTEYGLSSSVFTEDLRRGLRFARGIETGAVHVNGMTVHDEAGLPHGGTKASGFGRFNSVGMEEWVRTKTVTFRY